MGRRLINRRYKLGSRAPSMQTLTGDSGIANLPNAVTVNSTAVSASVVAHGNDATALTFPLQVGGISLPIAGSGTSPSLNQPAPGNGANDYMVKGGAGEYYQAGDTTTGNVGTNDILFRLAFYSTGTTSVFAAKRNSGVGWEVGIDSSDRLYCTIEDSSGTATVVSAVLTEGQFYFADIWLDRSGSAQIYINGVASGSAVAISGRALTLDSATALTLLADSGGATPTDGGLVYFGMWQSAAWFSTHLNATESAEAFQKWSGIYPTKASGTAAPTFSRASSAYATKWNGTSYDLINCSAGLPRVDYVFDDNGTPFKGMLIEPQATNLLPYSNDIDTGWTKFETTIDTGSTGGSPVPGKNAQGVIASASSGSHYVRRASTAAADNNCWWADLKKGSQPWVRFYIDGPNKACNFDLDNIALGTNGLDGGGIKDLGNGWVRCWAYAAVASSSAAGFRIYPATSGTNLNFLGDGSTITVYIDHTQHEIGTKPTSRIDTAGATATRLAEDLQYNGDNVTAGQGTIGAEILVDAHTPAAELSIAALSDGGSTDEMVRSYVDTGTQIPIFEAVDSTVAQWTITGSTDVVDGDIHAVKLPYQSNDAKQFVDNTLDGTPDTSCTVPTGIDEIDIGQDTSSANQLNGRIRNFRIYGFASSDV